MTRLWKKQPRWSVQLERISNKGTHRWFTCEKYHDPVEAWERMIEEQSPNLKARVWDVKTECVLMWPHHDYRQDPLKMRVLAKFGFIPEVWADEVFKQFEKNTFMRDLVDNQSVAR